MAPLSSLTSTLSLLLVASLSLVDARVTPVKRALEVPTTLPGTWQSQGCYTDGVGGRTLSSATYQSGTAMTAQACIAFCDRQSYSYAGTEYSGECFCGNALSASSAKAPETQCQMPCSGDANQPCGGPDRLNLFWNGKAPPAGPVTNPGVGPWRSVGCYTDGGARTLTTQVNPQGALTVATCTSACQAAGFVLAGMEYSVECFCGNTYQNGGQPAPSGCTMVCSGNSSEFCGGPDRLNVYSLSPVSSSTTSAASTPIVSSTTPIVSTTVGPDTTSIVSSTVSSSAVTSATTSTTTSAAPSTPSATGWEYLGCYTDNVGSRSLRFPQAVGGQNSHERCQSACLSAGYPISGTEYTVECFCDSVISNAGAKAADGEAGCSMPCQANATQKCGGPDRLTVWQYRGSITAPVNPPPVVNPPAGGSTVKPVTTGLPAPWAYRNCYIDNANGRILSNGQPESNTMTVETCIATCSRLGFSIAGLQYTSQCFCGNNIVNGGAVAASDTQCGMPCGGAPAEACGDANRMSVYSTSANFTTVPVPTVQNATLPTGWKYSGCVTDGAQQRTLPNFFELIDTLTPELCLTKCAEFGYSAAGLEFGRQCLCGDPSDVVASGARTVADGQCTYPCEGDPAVICGGPNLMSYYTGPESNKWATPANKGRYEFLIGGLVVPLITTLGINNKVTFVEKFGTGAPNTTGAYELDYSLTNDMGAAWRTMHMEADRSWTDVFCAAGLTLPDKSGRVITIGGWSYESTYGIRLYTPDGSPGVRGKNDWEENYSEVHMQDGRWYPGVMLMANGSILVVGGERGSNDVAVPTLEILPTPAGGRTALYMDWLARTDPNNLYPYLYVLPGGGIFVQYYNEARILDENTFNTIKTLPNVPASVTNPDGGRTYPLEGAAGIFPQYAPYTDPITFIVCGGSPGVAVGALDNCASIQPEAGNAQWTIERMPSRRVMPNMVSLPDGTFLILNGAKEGVAGFGLAKVPNLEALLYDPSKPVGERMSVLGSTIVARMYHSEAILLHDGRVLVTGSDPQDPEFPEEHRVEVYVPPYLTDGRSQPTYTIGQTDWAYSSSHSITVTSSTGPTSSMRVSLVAPITSTHGNSMNQRILFPQVNCGGNTCTIVAPPNAHVCPPGWYQLFLLDGPTPSYSQWVRIGGDPAALGNWPNFPDFTRPGV